MRKNVMGIGLSVQERKFIRTSLLHCA